MRLVAGIELVVYGGKRLRPEQLYFTCSRPVQEYCCSQVCGHRSRGRWWRSSSWGALSRRQEIRGFISCWEPSVPPWHCLDLGPGRWTLAFLDGSESTFETGRDSSHPPLSHPPVGGDSLVQTSGQSAPKECLRRSEIVDRASRYGVHGDSISGC